MQVEIKDKRTTGSWLLGDRFSWELFDFNGEEARAVRNDSYLFTTGFTSTRKGAIRSAKKAAERVRLTAKRKYVERIEV